MSATARPPSLGFRFLKRGLDVLVAGLLLLLLALPMGLIAVSIRALLGRPVLFRQLRPGRGFQPFTLYKFRTMSNAVDAENRPLPDAERLTRFGTFLRRFSLDELPQLINVLKGDMSLVGPRPLLVGYVPYFTERERRRFLVRPGITGWAQVNGRNGLPWDDRLALDVEYVERASFFLDLRILGRTAWQVPTRRGFTAHPQLLMQNLDEERAGRQHA